MMGVGPGIGRQLDEMLSDIGIGELAGLSVGGNTVLSGDLMGEGVWVTWGCMSVEGGVFFLGDGRVVELLGEGRVVEVTVGRVVAVTVTCFTGPRGCTCLGSSS